MFPWHNNSGRPLSSLSWLEAHHQAKLAERKQFARLILQKKPKRIVDLGCGPGLWLEVLNEFAPTDCHFVGLDSDPLLIKEAKSRSSDWKRKVEFEVCDIIQESKKIPNSDLFLAFNIFPYVTSPENFLEELRKKLQVGGNLIVRQYDGHTIRFGPMNNKLRFNIDTSLFASVSNSNKFHHYDLDRVFEILENSNFNKKDINFELFQRTSPYPKEFLDYYSNTIKWTMNYINESAMKELERWYKNLITEQDTSPSYFVEVDLIAELS